MSSETATPRVQVDPRAVVEAGLRAVAAMPDPVNRGRHRAAWALRLSALDPGAAMALVTAPVATPEEAAEPDTLAEVAMTAAGDRLRRFGESPEPWFTRAVELVRALPPHAALERLNALAELGMEWHERDPAAARALVASLAPEAAALSQRDTGGQHAALARALIGEALLVAGDPAGYDLLEQAVSAAADDATREAVLAFAAGALAAHDAARAAQAAARLADPGRRFEARLALLERCPGGCELSDLLPPLLADAHLVAHMQGPEPLVRLAHALWEHEPDRSRALLEEVLAETGYPAGVEAVAPEGAAQVRALQWAGAAAAAAETDREWAGEIFHAAAALAEQEADRVRRVTTRLLIANQMAASHPRAAVALFEQALAEAAQLEALWEVAHTLDVVFHADRSPYLPLEAARPLVEAALARLEGDDTRLPGMFGPMEAARHLAALDRAAAAALLRRLLARAVEAGDPDGMTQAALALHQLDPDAGRAAMEAAAERVAARLDCPTMSAFAREAAAAAPAAALRVAERIPDLRERAAARAAVAVYLYPEEPDRALELLCALEPPQTRSSALLQLADRLLGTGDRPHPQPLLADLP